MKFSHDHHHLIGRAHANGGKPCQDYAFSAAAEGGSTFAIVSDGCSSGGLTEVGSQVMTLSTAKAIRSYVQLNEKFGPELVSIACLENIKQAATTLELGRDDLLATRVYASISSQGGFVRIDGDGVAAIKYRNGEISATCWHWEDERVFYPIYAVSSVNAFIAGHGGDLGSERAEIEECLLNADGSVKKRASKKLSLEAGMRGLTIPISAADLTNIEYIAVYTDGVTQVEGKDWTDVVYELLAFKTTAGEFAKRRMNRVVKDAQSSGLKGPVDDISHAVIKIEHD